VGERRADAIRQLQHRYPDLNVVLLDDAFQHRAVRPHLNLLLMDYNRPFYRDYPFPAGRLREGRAGAGRAHAIVVTKCPADLSAAEQHTVRTGILAYAHPQTPVFFATLHYGQPVSLATHQSTAELRDVILVSGLANADPLEQYVRQTYSLQTHHRFADHHAYTRADLNQMLTGLTPGISLLTTEKDWVKLTDLLTPAERSALPLFYLPVAVQFLPDYAAAFTDFLNEADRTKNVRR
jgi:tetraacyldisaccharide 4'-kinase